MVHDLSPIVITRFMRNKRTLVFTPKLSLVPVYADKMFSLTHPVWGVEVYAATRENLIRELKENLSFLWDAYALEDDAKMTSNAVSLAKILRERIREE